MLARVLLEEGDTAEAFERAFEAQTLLDCLGHVDEFEAMVRLVFVESLLANGKLDDATARLSDAVTRLRVRATSISDDRARESFLRSVPDHQRTLTLWDELSSAKTKKAPLS